MELDHIAHLEESRQDLVFRDETDPAFDLDRLAVGVETEDRDRSLLLVEHSHRDMEEGGLAGAVATEKSDHLSSFDIEVDTVEDGFTGFERTVNVTEGEDAHFSPPFRLFGASGGRP